MTEMPLRNKSQGTLRIMLEPWAQTYDIEPGADVSIITNFNDALQPVSIDHWSENFIAIWVPAGTSVMSDGVPLLPLKEA
jgi:hypothetical protein